MADTEDDTEVTLVDVGVVVVLAGANLVRNVGKTCDRLLKTRQARLYSAAWLEAQKRKQAWARQTDPLYRVLWAQYTNLDAAEQAVAAGRGDTKYFSAKEAAAPTNIYDLFCVVIKTLPASVPGTVARWGADSVTRTLRGHSASDIAELDYFLCTGLADAVKTSVDQLGYGSVIRRQGTDAGGKIRVHAHATRHSWRGENEQWTTLADATNVGFSWLGANLANLDDTALRQWAEGAAGAVAEFGIDVDDETWQQDVWRTSYLLDRYSETGDCTAGNEALTWLGAHMGQLWKLDTTMWPVGQKV